MLFNLYNMFVYNSPGTESVLPLETRFWTSVLSSIFSMDRLLVIISMFLNRWAQYSFVLNNIMDSFASLCFFFFFIKAHTQCFYGSGLWCLEGSEKVPPDASGCKRVHAAWWCQFKKPVNMSLIQYGYLLITAYY